MEKYLKVSIIIPVYNAVRFLPECMHSIEEQKYKRLEVIFVNDCSTDESLEQLSFLSKSSGLDIIILNNTKNGGTAFSRNEGLKAASGDYVFFMDDDDTITDDCIELLAKSAVEKNCPDIVLCNVDAPNYVYKKIESPIFLEGNKSVRQSYFAHEWFEMPWNKLVRKDFLLQNSLFFSPEIYFEDSLWSFETALKADRVLLLPNITYHFRKSETQKTARADSDKNIEDALLLYNAMYEIVDDMDSMAYVMEVAQGFMFSQFVLNKKFRHLCYKKMRDLFSKRVVFRALFSFYISKGMKLMLLYRFMPSAVGFDYLNLYASKFRA